jgi:LysM repeat protein
MSQPDPYQTPPEGERSSFQSTSSRANLADHPLARLGANLLAATLLAVVGFLLWQRFLSPAGAQNAVPTQSPFSLSANEGSSLSLPPFTQAIGRAAESSIGRLTRPNTLIPTRARSEVITYTVREGDTLMGIADNYGLMAETMLWANFEELEDNPHLLRPDMVLNILPEDGVYHKWRDGDTLESVAAEFKTDPEKIMYHTGNNFDLAELSSDSSSIEPGTWVIVPGGSRPFKDWGPPTITRANPASASTYGPGHCGSIYTGPVGVGAFVWPTTERYISGYHYSAVHRGIDIGGRMGNAIFAADTGVVVYSGWSNFGYGNLIVIDHGNGYQTVYAHLSTFAVGCGDSVYQGSVIGAMGSTGNSTGPHLHFELIFSGTKPNPMDYLR